MPTGLAAGGNEIISAPEFQRNAFSESGYFRKSGWAGNYEAFAAGKGYVTRTGESQEAGKIILSSHTSRFAVTSRQITG